MGGGFVERTTGLAAGVSTREMWRWPDELGKPIGGGKVHLQAFRRFAALTGAVGTISFVAIGAAQLAWHAVAGGG